MQELLDTEWKATTVGTPPLQDDELNSYLSKLGNGWQVASGQLEKEFKFPTFNQALEYTNKVGTFADEKDHHPDIHLAWGKAKVVISTHHISGLAHMDFVWAANVEKIYQDEFAERMEK
ncbi:MAG: 4a-hydroxytetrahydrobiopterin dehydratase [Candidatus Heimdallarchaeota archaeon]|nr:4a-hydroxytetrahydrobiopterin dehydratase [Candidatus Heimdallarchaeota archaeon]